MQAAALIKACPQAEKRGGKSCSTLYSQLLSAPSVSSIPLLDATADNDNAENLGLMM